MPDEIVKQEETAGFIIPKNVVNEAAVRKVQEYLPELAEKTAAFGHFGRQSTEDGFFTWEKLDKINEFKALL